MEDRQKMYVKKTIPINLKSEVSARMTLLSIVIDQTKVGWGEAGTGRAGWLRGRHTAEGADRRQQ